MNASPQPGLSGVFVCLEQQLSFSSWLGSWDQACLWDGSLICFPEPHHTRVPRLRQALTNQSMHVRDKVWASQIWVAKSTLSLGGLLFTASTPRLVRPRQSKHAPPSLVVVEKPGVQGLNCFIS